MVRQLCLFRRRSDPKGLVPDHTLAPVKESVFVPYIFTYEEVLSIVDAATQHEGRNMCGGDAAGPHTRSVLHRDATG